MTEAVDRLYEQLLVLRCQAADPRAFQELVQRYHQRLGYYLRHLVDDAALVEDLLQDVWLTVFRKLGGLRSSAAFSVWLHRVARNVALARLRRERRWVELTDEPPAPQSSCEQNEFSPQDAPRVHAALQRLQPHHREVLVLRIVVGMTYEQIAEVIGRPTGTVRSRVHYAKQALRREMEG